MLSVYNYTDEKFIIELEAENKFDAIERLAMAFEGGDVCSDVPGLITALKEREEIMSTGIGFGLAIPHAKIDSVKKMSFAIGISENGINFDSMDGQPVHLVILVAAGEKQHKDYLRLLSSIMAILKREEIKERIINSGSAEEIVEIIKIESAK